MITEPPALRGSATILLLRDRHSEFELLLTRRHATLSAHARDELPLSPPPTLLTLQEILGQLPSPWFPARHPASEADREVATVIPKAISGRRRN